MKFNDLPPDYISPNDTKQVFFSYYTNDYNSFVTLRGDLINWLYPVEMKKKEKGWHQVSMQLKTGVYQYKYHVNGENWIIDPLNKRTCSYKGVKNSLLIVNGTPEPLIHCPCKPYFAIEKDGRIVIHAGLRYGFGNSIKIVWKDGDKNKITLMNHLYNEDEHAFYSVELPGSGNLLEYVFLLENGEYVGFGEKSAFRVNILDFKPDYPKWWEQSVIYTIFVDRFRKGEHKENWWLKNKEKKKKKISNIPLYNQIAEEPKAGGDLNGIINSLGYLAELGVNVLHLTPIFLSDSAHRYDVVDPLQIDPDLGNKTIFIQLLNEAKKLNIKIFLDITVTHVNHKFYAFEHVKKYGAQSPFWNWFEIYRYPFIWGMEPGYEHYQKGQWHQPLLNVNYEGVENYILKTFKYWTKLGVLGFRIDSAAGIPLKLIEKIKRTVRKSNPDTIVFGEVIPDNIYRYVSNDTLDAATNFSAQEFLYNNILRDNLDENLKYSEFIKQQLSVGYECSRGISFAGTHDQNRFLTLCKDKRRLKSAYILTFIRRDIPALYYGDEIGLSSYISKSGFEGVWQDRQCMSWNRDNWDNNLLEFFKKLIKIRKNSQCLQSGDEFLINPEITECDDYFDPNKVIVLRRTLKDNIIDSILNLSDESCRIKIPGNAPTNTKVLLVTENATIDNSNKTIKLFPWAGIIFERVLPKKSKMAFSDLLKKNRSIALTGYIEGLYEIPSLPTHVYLTVTEKCNLSCRHCINHSPEKTACKNVREVKPWLISKLKEVFAAADYFGFTHGGESLTSEYFFSILKQIKDAKSFYGLSSNYNIHLVSNGMMLNKSTFKKLADLGLTSLAISIDGATDNVNNYIRQGSSLNKIIKNIEDLIEIKTKNKLNIQVGISTVLCKSNAKELLDIVNMVIKLKLNWFKLEELCTVNMFAQDEFVDLKNPELTKLIILIAKKLNKERIVFVNHLFSPEICSCDSAKQEDIKNFLACDAFANRTEFKLCRLPWQQICVDPDGTIHSGDYYSEPIGNLLEKSFFDLWNCKKMQDERKQILTTNNKEKRHSCVYV